MTPQNVVSIGKCVCKHSRAAHQTKLGGCGFCPCVVFQLDEIIQEVKARKPAAPPAKPAS